MMNNNEEETSDQEIIKMDLGEEMVTVVNLQVQAFKLVEIEAIKEMAQV